MITNSSSPIGVPVVVIILLLPSIANTNPNVMVFVDPRSNMLYILDISCTSYIYIHKKSPDYRYHRNTKKSPHIPASKKDPGPGAQTIAEPFKGDRCSLLTADVKKNTSIRPTRQARITVFPVAGHGRNWPKAVSRLAKRETFSGKLHGESHSETNIYKCWVFHIYVSVYHWLNTT